MSYAQRHSVTITTDASGDATGYTPVVTGQIVSIAYAKTDYANGVDFDATGESSGTVFWAEDNVDSSKTVYPRAASHSTAGVALTYDGTRAVHTPVYASNERIKIVIDEGGDTKTGAFVVILA